MNRGDQVYIPSAFLSGKLQANWAIAILCEAEESLRQKAIQDYKQRFFIDVHPPRRPDRKIDTLNS